MIFVLSSDSIKSASQSFVYQFSQPLELSSGIDTTAAKLKEVRGELAQKGIVLVIARAKGPLRKMLERTGITELVGQNHFFPTVNSAVEAFHNR